MGKTILKLGLLALLAAVLCAAVEPASACGNRDRDCDSRQVCKLMVSKTVQVGIVIIEADGGDITVTYEAEEGWFLTSVALYADDTKPTSADPADFGDSAYGIVEEDLDEATTYEHTFTVDEGDCFYVAAHAEVAHVEACETQTPNLAAFCADLPSTATMTVERADEAYFTLTVTDAGDLNGVYGAYCVDRNKSIQEETVFDADVYCSYGLLPDDVFMSPENMAIVNYVLNTYYVGYDDGTFTYKALDIQYAIWVILGEGLPPRFDDLTDVPATNAIVQDALLYGEDFEPDCDDLIGVILLPWVLDEFGERTTSTRQAVIFAVPFECICKPTEERAWAWCGCKSKRIECGERGRYTQFCTCDHRDHCRYDCGFGHVWDTGRDGACKKAKRLFRKLRRSLRHRSRRGCD